jgi:hypothetical protein
MGMPRAALLAGALALVTASGTPSGDASGASIATAAEVRVATGDAERHDGVRPLEDRGVEIEVTLVPGRVRHLADAPCSPAC